MIESVVNKNLQRLVDEPKRIFPAAHKVPMTSFWYADLPILPKKK